MPDTATSEAVDVEPSDKRTKEWKEWNARQRLASVPCLTDAEREALTWDGFLRLVPWDEFARQTLQAGLNDRSAMMIANYGEKQSGLTGKVQQLHRVLFWCLKAGPDARGTSGEVEQE